MATATEKAHTATSPARRARFDSQDAAERAAAYVYERARSARFEPRVTNGPEAPVV